MEFNSFSPTNQLQHDGVTDIHSIQTFEQSVDRGIPVLKAICKKYGDSHEDLAVNTAVIEDLVRIKNSFRHSRAAWQFNEAMNAHDMVNSAICMQPTQDCEVENTLKKCRMRMLEVFSTFQSLKAKLMHELGRASRHACSRLTAERDEVLAMLSHASGAPAEVHTSDGQSSFTRVQIQVELDHVFQHNRQHQRPKTVAPPAKPSKARFIRQTLRNKSKPK
eukprot:760593-Hanusia_phi.AAC.13